MQKVLQLVLLLYPSSISTSTNPLQPLPINIQPITHHSTSTPTPTQQPTSQHHHPQNPTNPTVYQTVRFIKSATSSPILIRQGDSLKGKDKELDEKYDLEYDQEHDQEHDQKHNQEYDQKHDQEYDQEQEAFQGVLSDQAELGDEFGGVGTEQEDRDYIDRAGDAQIRQQNIIKPPKKKRKIDINININNIKVPPPPPFPSLPTLLTLATTSHHHTYTSIPPHTKAYSNALKEQTQAWEQVSMYQSRMRSIMRREKELEQVIGGLEGRIREGEAVLGGLLGEVEGVVGVVQGVEGERRGYMGRLGGLGEGVIQVIEQYSKINQKCNDYNSQITMKSTQLSTLQTQQTQTSLTLQSLHSQISTQTTTISSLRQALRTAQQTLSNHKQTLSQLLHRQSALPIRVQILKSQAYALAARYGRCRDAESVVLRDGVGMGV